ncbi:hypothetical protein [Lacrimispora sp.]|uniref:hypothetical protein n=1 Tax=Lacrimispora sp. TaxID=2719234 RepID=UPI00289CE932|nr:hypothetical protein [Lacrimispora sp.]
MWKRETGIVSFTLLSMEAAIRASFGLTVFSSLATTTLVLAEGMYYNIRRPWALGSKEILAYGK